MQKNVVCIGQKSIALVRQRATSPGSRTCSVAIVVVIVIFVAIPFGITAARAGITAIPFGITAARAGTRTTAPRAHARISPSATKKTKTTKSK